MPKKKINSQMGDNELSDLDLPQLTLKAIWLKYVNQINSDWSQSEINSENDIYTDSYEKIQLYISILYYYKQHRNTISLAEEIQFWQAAAKLLISSALTTDIIKSPIWKKFVLVDTMMLTPDTQWRYAVKDRLVNELKKSDTLRKLLNDQQDKEHNAFLMLMREQNYGRPGSKKHLLDTYRGALVALLMQWREVLPELKYPNAIVMENDIKLNSNSAEPAIQQFIEPYLNPEQAAGPPKLPDLASLVKQLAVGSLPFKKQTEVISMFLARMKVNRDIETEANIYKEFIHEMWYLGSNGAKNDVYQALYKQSMPLFSFVLAKTPGILRSAAGAELSIIESDAKIFDWFTKGKNKKLVLEAIANKTQQFVPLLTDQKNTALDVIIDEIKHKHKLNQAKQKFMLFGEGKGEGDLISKTRSAVTALLNKQQEHRAEEQENPPSSRSMRGGSQELK